MAEEFVRRTQRYVRCQMMEIKPAFEDPLKKYADAFKIMLDPKGRTMNSAQFTSLLERLEREGREVVFLIGGADGLPGNWLRSADLLLSLSPLTFPHELARVVVTEQIYRAFTSLRGHPYPR